MKEIKRIGAIAVVTAVLISGCSKPIEDGDVTVLSPETLASQLTEMPSEEQTTAKAERAARD